MPKRSLHRKSAPKTRKSSKAKRPNYLIALFIGVVVVLIVLAFQQRARDVQGIATNACKTGVSSFYVNSSCGVGKATEVGFSCYNGDAQIRTEGCKSVEAWKADARSYCGKASSCSLKVTPTSTPPVRPSPTPKPSGFRQINVKAVCTNTSSSPAYRQWLITNTNSNNVYFDYSINGGFKYHTGIKYKSTLELQTTVENTGNKIDSLRVYEGDKLVDNDAAINRQCALLTPTPTVRKYPTATPTPTLTPTPRISKYPTATPTPRQNVSLSCSPASLSVVPGGSPKLVAILKNSQGSRISNQTIFWRSGYGVGLVYPATSSTDSSGQASISYSVPYDLGKSGTDVVYAEYRGNGYYTTASCGIKVTYKSPATITPTPTPHS